MAIRIARRIVRFISKRAERYFDNEKTASSGSTDKEGIMIKQRDFSRRNFLKATGVGAIGALAAANLAACGQPTVASSDKTAEATATGPAFLQAPEPIVDFAETKEYDVVVVGAGESGLSAVHSALEAGATVACVQNVNSAQTTGNMGAYLDIDANDEAALQACVSFINWKSDYRSDRKLVEVWARNSQEALTWWAEEAAKSGIESIVHDAILPYNGYEIALHANTYFHVEGNHGGAALVIAESLASAGAEFFYNTPCVQLYKEGDAVKGAICTNENENHILFKASKGVILACGDYSSSDEMREYYAPDTKGFSRFVDFRDGSGLCAGMWAGAVMTPTTHTKMIHGEPANVRLEMPFLFLDRHGERFMDESCCRMGYMNNFARKYLAEVGFEDSTAAKFFSIVPSNWEDYYDEWKTGAPYDISMYNASNKVDPSKWISGETPEELAQNMIDYATKNEWAMDFTVESIVASIARYNELCASGRDDDFGKASKYMVEINGGPYYAIPRGSNKLPAILGGLIVDENHQCLNEAFDPIEGLFAVGNASGQFFGGVDYPMDIEGLSIGRAITSGYVCGGYVANL